MPISDIMSSQVRRFHQMNLFDAPCRSRPSANEPASEPCEDTAVDPGTATPVISGHSPSASRLIRYGISGAIRWDRIWRVTSKPPRRIRYHAVLQRIAAFGCLPITCANRYCALAQPFSDLARHYPHTSPLIHQMNRLGVVMGRWSGGPCRGSASSATPPPGDWRRRRPLDGDEYNGSEALPSGLRISGFVSLRHLVCADSSAGAPPGPRRDRPTWPTTRSCCVPSTPRCGPFWCASPS